MRAALSEARESFRWFVRAMGILAVLLSVGCTGHKADDGDGREDPHPDTAIGPRRWSFVEAGDALTCGIDLHGRVECWGLVGVDGGSDTGPGGSAYDDSVLYPPALRFQSIALGMNWFNYDSGDHGCGLLTGGGAACWGHDRFGETNPPDDVFVQIEADGGASWGVTAEGELRCWGSCDALPSEPYRSVSEVYGYGAALAANGDVETWHGYGYSDTTVRGPFASATGGTLSCGIREDASMTCWWASDPGEPSSQKLVPAGAFAQVCGSGDFDCALSVDGGAVCFGEWASEEIRNVPAVRLTQISCGSTHACGVTSDHEIVCWGNMSHGQGTPPD